MNKPTKVKKPGISWILIFAVSSITIYMFVRLYNFINMDDGVSFTPLIIAMIVFLIIHSATNIFAGIDNEKYHKQQVAKKYVDYLITKGYSEVDAKKYVTKKIEEVGVYTVETELKNLTLQKITDQISNLRNK